MTTTLSTYNQKLWTPFDDLGLYLGLPRYDNESISNYKDRLKSVFTHRASTSYNGLLNGIAQEFGLERKIAFSITVDNDVYPKWFINKDSSKLVVYSTYHSPTNYSELCSIDLRASTFVSIQDLIDELLANGLGVTQYDTSIVDKPAFFLVNSTSHEVFTETLAATKSYSLAKKNIVPGTITFSNQLLFANEVDSYDNLTDYGDYCINYTSSIVNTYGYSGDSSIVFSYTYNSSPFFLYYLPVYIANFFDENFLETIFQKSIKAVYTNTTDMYRYDIPKAEFIEFFTELKNLNKIYWGK